MLFRSIAFAVLGIRNQVVMADTVSNTNNSTVNEPMVDNPEVNEPIISDPVTDTVLGFGTQLDFGVYGAYHAVYDSNRNLWTLGFWNENVVRAGSKNLADLKREGGSISFVMPADGWINNSAGELFVDGTKWDLGNYGESPSEETLIKKGQTIAVSYGPNNDSAGFQLWFK